ncbi:MAG: inositol monophosphatase family protein [Rhodoluna sp.]
MIANDLQLAIRAAESAGQLLLEFWARRDELTVRNKAAGDFVSNADVSAENHLREILLGERPEDSWLGEEGGGVGKSSRRWIVDPLDGTTNFLKGIPHWAVSVALEIEGQLSVGVVHDPLKSETYAAQSGHGATLNGATISVSETDRLSSSLFGTGIPFGEMPNIGEHASQIARLMPLCAGVRRMGVASLDLSYVASGRLDGFWERNLRLWDIAGGLVVLRESGAVVEGWEAKVSPEQYGDVITATPELFPVFAASLRQS